MGRSITDNLQGHHSSCQSKQRGFLLPPSPVTRRCLLSRATSSLQPSSLACVSHSTPLPSTAGSSFLLPGSNRKLPLRSQGCECLTLRAASIPRELGQAIQEPVQPSLLAPPPCPQSHLVAHLPSLSTSTSNRNSGFLLKHALFVALVLINHYCNGPPLLAFLLQVSNAQPPNPPKPDPPWPHRSLAQPCIQRGSAWSPAGASTDVTILGTIQGSDMLAGRGNDLPGLQPTGLRV